MESLVLIWSRYKAVIVIFFLVLILTLIGWSIYASYQKVTFTIAPNKPGLTVNVYKNDVDNDEASPESLVKADNLVKTVDTSSTIKLKQGHYIWQTAGSNDYTRQTTKFVLKNEAISFEINPTMTDGKLTSLLKTESPAVQKAILASVLGISPTYQLGAGKLYDNGEWYGTIIYPSKPFEFLSTNFVDIYRVVAHKDNGVWKVVTNPPELSLSAKKYTTIPRDILSDVNKQKY